ncbi:MAG: hypothetical protein KBS78_09520 [Bacteroidales bacterium]|nr:hypothetical protein [Candidatus Cryptobacteroides faecihippi]
MGKLAEGIFKIRCFARWVRKFITEDIWNMVLSDVGKAKAKLVKVV